MERSLRFQQHPSPPARSPSAHPNGIPPRGTFSAHMLLQEQHTALLGSPTSRSSAPLSVLSSPRSGFECSPDYHQVPQAETTKRSPVKRQSNRGLSSVPSLSPSPPSPPPSRLRQVRAGSSASVVHPMRRPTATQAHHTDARNNNNSPGTSSNNRTRAHSSPQISPRGVRKVLDPGTQQQQARASTKRGVSRVDSPIGINFGTNDDNNNQIGNGDEYQEDGFVLAPTPSVHPIDTLAKKLRQQALELTGVYEQLEKKTQRLKDQENQIQELQFQLENLKCVKQQSTNSTNHKTTATVGANRRASAVHSGGKSSNGTHQSGAGGSKCPTGVQDTASVAAASSKKIEELQQQVKNLEGEKKQHELSTKRIESAIAELKLHQSSRMQQHLAGNEDPRNPRNSEKASTTPEVLLQEQQLYIRVLEEAVYLKASELHVTGHEELLMVLAELRHTIYQQEQDVAEKQRQVDAMKTRLLEQSEKQLTQTQQLDAKSTKRELEIYELRQEKSTLANQLDQVQRQLQRGNEQNQRLQVSVKDLNEREELLNEKLTSTTQLKTLAESKVDKLTQSLQETQAKLSQMTSEYEHEARTSSRLSGDFATKTAQLEELKALQDELLCRIDSYASKSEATTLEKDNLENQLQGALTREQSKVKQLQELVSAKGDDLRGLSDQLEAAERLTKETQVRLDAMSKQKLALENQIEDERLQMEKALDDQNLVLNEKKRAIEASEELWNGMQETLKELDAAMSASLAIMLFNSDSKSYDNVDENVGFIDEAPAGLQELKLCMHSLSHLMTSESISCDKLPNHLPSFRDLIKRVHRVMTSSVEDLMNEHGSWTRERGDLRNASEELHATAQICDREMRKVHEEHLRAREQLEEVSIEFAARNHETMRLKYILQELNNEIESLRAFEQQVAEQNRVVADQGLQIEELTGKVQACEASNAKQKAALEEKRQLINQLREELQEANDRLKHLEQVESAFENAVELTEQQNARSEELLLKLQDLENLNCDQEESIEAFKAKEKAFSNRFRGLFRQYCEHLRASSSAVKSRVKRAGNREVDAKFVERLNMYESEEQRGDVARMMQIFPTLLEDFVGCSNTAKPKEVEYDEAIKPQKLLVERMDHVQGYPVKPKARNDPKVSGSRGTGNMSSSKLKSERDAVTAFAVAATRSPPPHKVYALKPPFSELMESLNHRSAGHGHIIAPRPPSDAKRLHQRHELGEQKQKGSQSFTRPAAHRTPTKSAAKHTEDVCFQEQLELIRDAFQTFKAPQ